MDIRKDEREREKLKEASPRRRRKKHLKRKNNQDKSFSRERSGQKTKMHSPTTLIASEQTTKKKQHGQHTRDNDPRMETREAKKRQNWAEKRPFYGVPNDI